MSVDEIKRRRRRKPGDIASLQRTLWAGLLTIEDLLADPDPAMQIRAAHALGTLAGTYLKALETSELSRRVERLEQQLELQQPQTMRGGTRWAS
jgi:hypothetical protein